MPKKPKKLNPLDLLRDDGRPEVYDTGTVPVSEGHPCFVCNSRGFIWRRFHLNNEVFMTSPVNTPGAEIAFVCREHLPEDTVIFNPVTNECRNKAGDNVWVET